MAKEKLGRIETLEVSKDTKKCLNCPLCRSCRLVKTPSRSREWEE